MTSKINAHLREIRFVQWFLPITSIVLETGTFDPHALNNPAVVHNKWLYQKRQRFIHEAEDLVVFSPSFNKKGGSM